MKKLPRLRKKKVEAAETPNRITNETVAEHRERVLAGGRRFKYPMQYAKHRLVINTIIISVVALILVTALVWWQLYPSQNTSTFFYRITRVIPLPVAVVDGQQVRYSDYLMWFRSQEHNLQYKQGVDLYAKENKTQLDLIKRQSLDDTIADSYAAKLAVDLHLSVSDNEVNNDIKLQRQSSDGQMSEETYYAIILDHFNWSPDELKAVTARKLLHQKVAYAIDATASKLQSEMTDALKASQDFDKVVAAVQPVNEIKIEANITPLVPSNNQDGGLADQAAKLAIGQTSPVFKSTNGDGYYVVKLLQKDNNNRISYASLKVPLTAFDKQLTALKSAHLVSEYISVPVVNIPSSNQ
ncbi:MAG: hypothetical protein JWO07_755 [Candidatus Saccharibacteria bacterium]|nr:hypothetical protein [Candidatus Saccharibacteria bacterium]